MGYRHLFLVPSYNIMTSSPLINFFFFPLTRGKRRVWGNERDKKGGKNEKKTKKIKE
jgi:hypothetical protein